MVLQYILKQFFMLQNSPLPAVLCKAVRIFLLTCKPHNPKHTMHTFADGLSLHLISNTALHGVDVIGTRLAFTVLLLAVRQSLTSYWYLICPEPEIFRRTNTDLEQPSPCNELEYLRTPQKPRRLLQILRRGESFFFNSSRSSPKASFPNEMTFISVLSSNVFPPQIRCSIWST